MRKYIKAKKTIVSQFAKQFDLTPTQYIYIYIYIYIDLYMRLNFLKRQKKNKAKGLNRVKSISNNNPSMDDAHKTTEIFT